MSSGSGFPPGETVVEVPFGSSPSTTPPPATNANPQLTSLGETTDGFNVFRLRNRTEEEITVQLTGTNGYDEVFTIPAQTDFVVCTDSTGNATFTLSWDRPDGTVFTATRAANQSANNAFDPSFNFCFAPGTPIATPDGERAVEDLKAGDLVLTADGDAVPVKWIGYQTLYKMLSRDTSYCPVRIRAGALGQNVPHRDLYVTGDHGILVGGVMVNAAALVNGTTIVRVPASEVPAYLTYYHVETENHDIIVAAGALAETFVDGTSREGFDNYAEYVSLFGEPDGRMPVLPYPRAFGTRQVPEWVHDLVAARAEAMGMAVEASAA